MNTTIITTCLTLLASFAFSEKILGVFPGQGYSQYILGEKLMTTLAQRGHDVTVISRFKPKHELKNLKTILVDSRGDTTNMNYFELDEITPYKMEFFLHRFTKGLAEGILAHEQVQDLIRSNRTFDVAIVEIFGNEAHMGFAKHFNATLITFSSNGLTDWISDLVGNVMLPSVVPMRLNAFGNKMDFWERLQNSVFHVFNVILKKYLHFPEQQELLDKYFPGKMDLGEVMNNVSLVLANSHVATADPTMLTSSIIEIGGFHIETKRLPQEMETFLNGAEHGAVLFSLGSNLRSKDLTKEKLDVILKVFSVMKQRILWKFENDNIPNKPANLYISKWLPQTDILAHPNTIGFITHCGLLSTTESTYFGVPTIGMPIFGDQKMNSRRAVQRGVQIHLPFSQITVKTFSNALNELVNNPSYRNKAKKFSAIMKDEVVHPLDLAIHWIEHVSRFGGSYLRNASMDLNWFQLYLLDVASFVIACVITVAALIGYLIRKILCKTSKTKLKGA